MILETANPIIVAMILVPGLLCAALIGVAALNQLWKERKRDDETRKFILDNQQPYRQLLIEPYHPEDQPGNDEVPDEEEEFNAAMEEEFGNE